MYRHGFEVYEMLVRIPLMVRAPGMTPRRIDVPRSAIDLAPTILELTGAPAEASFQGKSLVPELYGKPVLGVVESDVVFSAAKLFFAYGLCNALTFPLSVGATAILKVADTLVPRRRKIIGDIREDVCSWLTSKKIDFVPSVSNKVMIDCKGPGSEVFQARLKEKVVIGRTWSAWPTHVRVSIGTADEMAKFKTAFGKVMAV